MIGLVRFVDLSHVVEHDMVTCPGLPAPVISDHLSRQASEAHYAEGTTFQIGRIAMVANTGTYVDAPFHRYADGRELSSLAHLDAVVVRVRTGERRLGPELFEPHDVANKAVLVDMGRDVKWAPVPDTRGRRASA
jgi:arylformamidase